MLSSLWTLTLLLGEFALRIGFVVHILMKRRATDAGRLAWIVMILAVPGLGMAAYLLIGDTRLGRRRAARHREVIARIRRTCVLPPEFLSQLAPSIDADYEHLAALAESVADNTARNGNRLTLIADTDLLIQSLVEDIESAESFCHLEFYIFLCDHSGARVATALMHAARRGIRCRLLVDGVGSRSFLKSSLRDELERTGVIVVESLPARLIRMALARLDLRNHRKMAIIDGRIAYTGSHNIADAEFAVKPQYAPWVDAMVRMEGPCVFDVHRIFLEDWYLETHDLAEPDHQALPHVFSDGVTAQVMGTGPNAFNEALRLTTRAAFYTAREELIVTTPYFVPDEATFSALCAAARRGIEAHIVLPERNDSPLVAAASRSRYEAMLEAGVQIHEFGAGLLHAKTMTVDRKIAMVSTANLDRRSFELNLELSLMVYDSDFASQLRFLQHGYIARSTTIELGQWHRQRFHRRLWNNTVGLMSPLL